MGSGCNKTNTKDRPINIIPDRGVKYTGPAIPSLGICNGDYLDEIEQVILTKLQSFAIGQGISIPEINYQDCAFIEAFVASAAADNTLTGIIKNIFTALCQLNTKLQVNGQAITNIETALNYAIAPGCLTVSNTRIDTVLNALISAFCSFQQKVTAIFGSLDNPTLSTTIVNQITDTVITQVFNNIHGCTQNDVYKVGTGINTQIYINGVVPIGGLMFGKWDRSYFDNTGLGLDSKGLCGWAIANGLNGTEDYRGYSFAMATNIDSSKSLDNIVNPVFLGDADFSTNIGDTKGQYKVRLTANQSGLPPHVHPINDPGHIHTNGQYTLLLKHNGLVTVNSNDNNDTTGREPNLEDSQPMLSSTTGITIGQNGAQNASELHENRQPTKYLNVIQRIA